MKFSSTAWFRGSVCAALLPTMTGCLTALVWTPVCQDRAVAPAIAGLVRNYPRSGDQAIVVNYRALGDWHDVNLVVPLDPDGDAVKPFVPEGKAHIVYYENSYDPAPVAGRLSTDQLTALFGAGKSIGPNRPALATHLTAAEFYPVAKFTPAMRYNWPAHPGSACMLAFRTDDAGQIVPIAIDYHPGQIGPIRLPAGTHLLVVPASVDRPDGDRAKNVAEAILLTPVTVGGDAAVAGAVSAVAVVAVIVAVPVYIVVDAIRPTTQPSPTTAPSAQPAPPGPITVPIEIGPTGSSLAASRIVIQKSVFP